MLDAETFAPATRPRRWSTGRSALRDGLIVHVGLEGRPGEVVGYRAIKNSDVIDVDRVGGYAAGISGSRFSPARTGGSCSIPTQFYILASREKMQIPADLAAEMAPIDPAIGEFRVHYAGFFDPGFGQGTDGRPAARAVLEVRTATCRSCSRTASRSAAGVRKTRRRADELYGAGATSNYQHQGLKLSKHFRG